MNNERLDAAINAITDKNWGFLKAWKSDYEGSLNPENISVGEARFFKIIGRIFPEKIMPFIIRQWGGEEGEKKFKEKLTSENPVVQ